MHNWENFEIACVNYLRESFGDVADFEECGGSNSTTPDILVKSANGSQRRRSPLHNVDSSFFSQIAKGKYLNTAPRITAN